MTTTSLRIETGKAKGLAALAAIALAFALSLCLAPAFGQAAWADDEADAVGDEAVAVDEAAAVDEAVVEAAEAEAVEVEAETPVEEAVVEEEAELATGTIADLIDASLFSSRRVAEGDLVLLDADLSKNNINMNAYNAMVTGFTNLSSEIDMKPYYIYKSEFVNLFWMIMYTRPDIFYVTDSSSYTYNTSTNQIISIKPAYAYSTSTIRSMKGTYNDAVSAAAERCAIFPSQVERAHAAYDYIVSSCRNDSGSDINYTAYGALVNQKAAGAGYTLGVMAILNEMGMENGSVAQDSQGWVWGIVKVDGSWYHIDAENEVLNKTSSYFHTFFLKSDSAYKNYGYPTGWYTMPYDYYASNTQYDNRSNSSKDQWKNECPFKLDPSAKSYRNPYSDVHPRDWFYPGVTYCNRNSLMGGYSGTSLFGPSDTMTRAMVVTVLYRIAGSPSVQGAMPFVDCDPSAYYAKAVVWASKTGITTGYTPTTFGPNDFVTREQFATFLFRYADYKGYNPRERADISGYPDAWQVDNYAYDAMRWANYKGIITGKDGKYLAPLGGAQRCEAATILMRFDKLY